MNSILLEYQKKKLIKAKVSEVIKSNEYDTVYPKPVNYEDMTQEEIDAIVRIQSMSYLRTIKKATVFIASVIAILVAYSILPTTIVSLAYLFIERY